jgi:hypothetical protein
MNGRIYDPYIGRFLSVDPIIQSPDNSQSYNGYGYCLNNPLKYSDPSGMLQEPRPNPSDAGYPYNPEAVAWLVNYYYQSMLGGGGAGVNTVTGYWNRNASTFGMLSVREEGDYIIDNATGEIIDKKENKEKYGHWEKRNTITVNSSTGDIINGEKIPYCPGECERADVWVWDVPQHNDLNDWFRTLPDLDRQTITTINSMGILLGSVNALAYTTGGPAVGGFVSSVLIYPSIAISAFTTMDVVGDYFRNPNPSQGELIHVYVSTAVKTLGTFYWPFAIPAGVYGILDVNGKFHWNKFDK